LIVASLYLENFHRTYSSQGLYHWSTGSSFSTISFHLGIVVLSLFGCSAEPHIDLYCCDDLVSIFEREEIILVCGVFIRLPMEKTSFGTWFPPMHILVGFLVNVAGSRDSGRRVRNIVPVGMRSACLNSVEIGHSMSGGKSKVAGVKVRPFLPIVSTLTINHILSTLDFSPSKPPRGRFPYLLK
jgi:hypothetical protein